MTHYHWRGIDLVVRCYLQPNSHKEGLVGIYNNQLKLKITAPAVDGKANTQLCTFLAKQFGVAKSKVTLIKGATSRQKTVVVHQPVLFPEQACIDGTERAKKS